MSTIKTDIMKAFKANEGKEMTPSDVAREMQKMGLFVPYSADVRIRQLWKRGEIKRVRRGVYMYGIQLTHSEKLLRKFFNL